MITTLYLFILIQLTLVSVGDLRTRKIPNIWSLLNISFYILLLMLFPRLFPFHIESIYLFFTFLFLGFVLFVAKVMGGGDAKYLASSALLIPYSMMGIYLEFLLISIVIFASFFFIQNLIKNRKDISNYLKSFYLKGVKNYFGTKFAFAPVILLAWIFTGLKFFNFLNDN